MNLPRTTIVPQGDRERHVSADGAIDVDRIPPANLQAEEALIGSVLGCREALEAVLPIVRPQDFYGAIHRRIFEAISRLYSRSVPFDKVAIVEQLRRDGAFESLEVHAVTGLLSVAMREAVGDRASVVYFARIIRERAFLRGLSEVGRQIVDLGFAEWDAAVAYRSAAQLLRALRQDFGGVIV